MREAGGFVAAGLPVSAGSPMPRTALLVVGGEPALGTRLACGARPAWGVTPAWPGVRPAWLAGSRLVWRAAEQLTDLVALDAFCPGLAARTWITQPRERLAGGVSCS